ncbi:hypothetical protein M8494_12290 [Serratia ureilytica]
MYWPDERLLCELEQALGALQQQIAPLRLLAARVFNLPEEVEKRRGTSGHLTYRGRTACGASGARSGAGALSAAVYPP